MEAATGWTAGQPGRVRLQAVEKRKNQETPHPAAMQGREVQFWLTPQRWNLFTDEAVPLEFTRRSAEQIDLKLPADLETGWYKVTAVVADDEGRKHTPMRVFKDKKNLGKFRSQKTVSIRNPSKPKPFLIHTERNRCVYSRGEEFRVFVSVRHAKGLRAPVTLLLDEKELATDTLVAPPGQERTMVVDVPASLSRSLAPGRMDLQVKAGGQIWDTYPIELVNPEPVSGGGRWAHTMPYGYGGGITSDAVMPWTMADRKNRFERVEKGIHKASFWNNFYSPNIPVRSPGMNLPEADAPDMPPSVAMGRPALPHALYQELMRQGIAFGVTPGYGEDYRAEVYMPIPTVVEDQMRQMGRKYVNSAMGVAQHPNFVAMYTDFYGHMDFTGAGEIASEQLKEIRERLWKEGTRAAGLSGVAKPRKYPTSRKSLSKDLQGLLKDKAKQKAWDGFWKSQAERYKADGKKWMEKRSESEKRSLWTQAWRAAGVTSVPAAPTYIPLPELDKENRAKANGDANYLYATHALRGIERAYGTFTGMVEEEFPTVFTIHNRLGMNHSKVSHAWTGIRTPNVDPAYTRGASAISASEWNLDAVPRPYFLSTFYNRTLIDRGMAVYRCGLWKQMGMPSRFMRDAVMWGGRQIQTYFDQTSNMTWSHQGADQTTYAANERMRSVSEFLVAYSDLFNQLEPIREVGLYVPPEGGPWGTGVTRGHYVGLLTALMANHQVHMVSHGDIAEGALNQYPIVYAPGIHDADSFYDFEKKAFRDYVSKGGQVVGAPPPNYYHPEEVYKGTGISNRKVPVLDDKGNPRKNKDGSIKTKTEWTEDFRTWAKIDRKYVWGWLNRNVQVAPIDIFSLYTHTENGKPATWSGSHWTGHHNWAKYRGPSLAQAPILDGVFSGLTDPMVKKNRPEVFVNINKPEDPDAKGLFLFASNWTLPTQEELFKYRVPQGFFNSGVQPARATLKVKSSGIGAVYDVISAREVPHRIEAGRVVFDADLDSVEGRVYALYPAKVVGARLLLPETLRAGTPLQARFELLDPSGSAMKVLGSVKVTLRDAEGDVFTEVFRSLPADGRLPALDLPPGNGLQLEVIDTVTGKMASATLDVQSGNATALVADPVTIYREDRIAGWLKQNRSKTIRILVEDGRYTFAKDGKRTLAEPNPNRDQHMQIAQGVKSALQKAGIRSEVTSTGAAITGPLYAHPWTGKMAGYRNRHAVPNARVEGPVILVGSASVPGLVRQMEQAGVAPRQWSGAPTRNGRAAISWIPNALNPSEHTVALVASDAAGFRLAAEKLVALAGTSGATDSFWMAREEVRRRWTPSEIQQHKEQKLGLKAPEVPLGDLGRVVEAEGQWPGMNEALGTAVFALNASPGGVAVGTKSWVKPVGRLSPEGEILGFKGGGSMVTPRDVGICPDGKTVAAGFSLMGRVAMWQDNVEKLNRPSGIVYSNNNPFGWDSFKDTDRQLGVSPDNKVFVINAGTAGIQGFDAQGRKIWTLRNDTRDSRPLGNASAEFGFSPDGQWVLVNTLRKEPNVKIRMTVSKMRKDKKGRWNKKDQYPDTVTVPANVYIEQLNLVNTNTGKVRWTQITGGSAEHPTEGYRLWAPGKEMEFREVIEGKTMKWKGKGEPARMNGSPLLPANRLNLNMWHLYSCVGPQGSWAISGTRDAMFNLHDENGNILRLFRPVDLPKALDPGQMIPIRFATGTRGNGLVLFAPQSRRLFRYSVHIGSPAERKRAAMLRDENSRIIRTIESELKNTKNYGNYGKKEYLAAFEQKIEPVPSDLRKELVDKMGRVPSERRAKRKRDYRWFQELVGRIRLRLIEEDRSAMDAAVGLKLEQDISLPALICDAEISPDLRTAYVGCWDGTVRAIDLQSGAEKWSTEVIGGSQIALARSASGQVLAVYAGGSRGDVSRLDPATGERKWTRNVTRATNSL